jgi:hypothetical protein
MSKDKELLVEKARVVLVGFKKDKDRHHGAKALAEQLGMTYEEASEMAEQVPVEIMQPLPMEAAENLAGRLLASGALVEVVPLSRELGGGRTCYRHPHKLAMAKCKVCGKLLCNLCLIESKGKLFCEEHYKRFKFKIWFKLVAVLVIFVSSFLSWYLFDAQIMQLVRRLMPLSTQRVALVVFTVNPNKKTAEFYTNLMRSGSEPEYRQGDDHNLAAIDGWFQKQYNDITNLNDTDVFDVDVYGLFDTEVPPPIFEFVNSSPQSIRGYVQALARNNNYALTAYDFYLFIYLTNESPVEMDFVEKLGIYDGKYGIFVYPLKQIWSNDYYVMALANLLARMTGANPHLDDKGFPFFPTGYAQPGIDPLYPQPNAELMAGYIPTARYSISRPYTLDDVTIGAQTAYELGWVSRGFVRKAYSDLK